MPEIENDAASNADKDLPEGTDLFTRVFESGSANANLRFFVEERVELLDSKAAAESPAKKNADKTDKVGPTDPERVINATVMVRSKATEEEMDRTIENIASGKSKPLTDKEFNERFGADPQALERVLKFARQSGLEAIDVDKNSGRVLLKGKVKDFKEAFKVELEDHKSPLGGIMRERHGLVSLPRSLAKDITGVFGLETTPIAHSNAIRYSENQSHGIFKPRVYGGMSPADAAKAYEFPEESKGKGQGVAILQFGGGLDEKDNAQYYKDNGLPLPEISIVKLNGAKGELSYDRSDDEVALDSQVLGVVAPEAKQMIIFAPNSDQGFLDAVTRATFTKADETANSAISISWGAPETMWSKQAIENLNLAFKKAALKGISVFAATGDLGAANGTEKFAADYPASDPYVIGTGGTELTLDEKGGIASESSWSGSGGGISEYNSVPDYQQPLELPENANKNGIRGKGLPDIAGNANPATGYKIRVHGFESIMGGTSSVAPLYAGLSLRLNGILGRRVGFLNPFFYENGKSNIFRDMQTGDNGGYKAGPGWDAVTGWGVINGQNMLKELQKQKKARPA